MGSTKPRRKRPPSRKSVTAKLRTKVAVLENEVACLQNEIKALRRDEAEAMRELRQSLPPSKTEHVHDVAQLARLAAHAASIGQTISTGATRALRAAGYMPTGPEDVAARIGGALFLKEGQIVVEKWQADALREKFEDIFGDDA